jgi:serine/threonine-protein kinase
MTSPAESRDIAREAALAALLSQVLDRMQAGEMLECDQVCRQHPEFQSEIRELWGALVIAQVAGIEARSSLNGQADSDKHGGVQASTAASQYTTGVHHLPYCIGDYELQEIIGRGGMGVVYRARQLSLNREVAIKMIQENRPLNPETRNRFFTEAQATGRLQHPCIVPVYEVSEHLGQPYFSMQLIRGQTLAEELRQGPILQRRAARIIADVSRGIGYAHSLGILHRDIKPSNIMLDENDRVRITDFGLAKLIDSHDSLTRTGATVGTPSYMAPEQAAGRSAQVSPRSDVYSLGAVLYHLLAGRPPLIGDSPIQLAMQILEHEPPPLRLIEPGVDRDLEMIVSRCIQKPPDLRYASADALADDLEAFLRDEPVQARSGRLLEVLARWFRETHHAVVLENWGLLWMWHSLVLLIVSWMTELLHWNGVTNRAGYAGLWTLGLGTWAFVFWALRHRMGPVTFVERQIAHVWGASLLAIAMLTPLEWLLDLKPLTLSPILPMIGSMVFVVKAGILSGRFYLQALALALTSFGMAVYPQVAHLMFGVVSGLCFFIPGLKYFRQRYRSQAME